MLKTAAGAAQQLAAGQRGERQPASVASFCRTAHPIQPADIDQLQLEPVGRHQLGLHAALRADEEDLVAAPRAARAPRPAPESRGRPCLRPP